MNRRFLAGKVRDSQSIAKNREDTVNKDTLLIVFLQTSQHVWRQLKLTPDDNWN